MTFRRPSVQITSIAPWIPFLVATILACPSLIQGQTVVSGCGTIHGNAVWDANNTFVLNGCSLSIPAGSSLTILPGTIVKLAGSHDMIAVDGSLILAGTADAPVVVTSLHDDTAGGDTNGDGAATLPAPGDWGWILFNQGSVGSLQYADLAFGGVGYHGYTHWAMVKVYGPATVAVDHSTLRQSWHDGLYAENASVDISHSRFADHGNIGLNFEGLEASRALVLSDNSFATAATGDIAARIKFIQSPGSVRTVGNHANGSGWNGLLLEGRVEQDLILASDPGLPFLVSSTLSIAPAANLTVSPGSIFKLTGCGPKILVEGTLLANGTDGAPIVLTSIRDDTTAGDTNGDGSTSTAAPGDWGDVRFSAGSSGTWQNATLRFGGVACSGYDSYSMLQAYTATVALEHSTLADAWGNGLYAENSSVAVRHGRILGNGQHAASAGLLYNGLDPSRRLEISDTVFETRSSLQTAGRLTLGTHPHQIHLLRNQASGSGRNGIVVSGSVQQDLFIDNVDSLPFIVDASLHIATNASLSLTPGSVFKFTGCGRKLAIDGNLVARGTTKAPIVFTSLADDTRGGDTNGDGTKSLPQPSDWGYLGFAPHSLGTLQNVFVGYGGVGCSGYDLYTLLAADDATVDVEDTTFAAYRWNAVYSFESRLRVQQSHFANDLPDSPMAIRNGGRRLWVDARHNWWGDASGPHHPTLNPTGRGAPVTDLVRFLPWAIDASGTETTQLLVAGPSRVSPGETSSYFVDYFAGRSIEDAVLVVALPPHATYVPDSASGIYRPDRHELFWRLGNLSAAAEGRLAFELTHAWGQPADSEANLAGLMLGEGVPSALPRESYLAYVVDSVLESIPMSDAELASERNDDPAFDQLLEDLISKGFDLATANRIRWAAAPSLTKVVLVDHRRNATAIVDRSADDATAITSYPASVVLSTASGSATLDLDTYAIDLGGSWGNGTTRTATQAGFSDCMNNCLADNRAAFMARTRAKLSGIPACRRWLWDRIASAESDCLKSLSRLPLAVLDVRNSLDLTGCLGECSVDPRIHFCVEDQVSCFPDTGLGSGAWVHACDTTTGKLRTAKFERCAAGEPCIQSVGCYARALAAGRVTGKLSTAVRLPRDPNAKVGKAGDVLAGEMLTYTVTYENEGAGTAYGVYVRDELGPEFDVDSLDLLGQGEFVAATRTILWEVGELAPKGEAGSKGERTFHVRLRPDLPDATVVANQAVVFFPSGPEETPTNSVVNIIQPLVAMPQQLETNSAQPLDITLAGNGIAGRPLTFVLAEAPLNGVLGGTPPNLTYSPVADFSGQDHFTFSVDDGVRRSRPAMVRIVVTPSADDTSAPRVLWSTPEPDTVVREVPVDPVDDDGPVARYAPFLRIGFSEAMDPNTIDTTNLRVVDSTGAMIPISVRWDGTANEAELAAQRRWGDGGYSVTVDSATLDAAGNPLESEYVWSFRVDTGAVHCAGDCDGSGEVTVDELIVGVNIALGTTSAMQCTAMDTSGEGQVTVDELIAAVNKALLGCA